MKALRPLAIAALASAAVLSACSSTSMQPYNSGYGSGYGSGYNNMTASGYGTIESIQVTRADGRTSGAGAIVGGLVGALAGNQVGSGGGRTAATVAGGVAGAAIGNQVEASRNANTGGQQLYQINVRMDNGEYRTVTQDSIYDLGVGARVRIMDGRVYRY